MNRLQRQWCEQVWTAGDGDIRHAALTVVAGMGLTPDGCPLSERGLRVLLRSYKNSGHVEPLNAVGVALPRFDAVASASGTEVTSAGLTEAADYWLGHRLVMTSGDQQGQERWVRAFAAGVLTIDRALPGDPVEDDEFYLMPLRVTEQAWRGHVADSWYCYAVQQISGLGVRGPIGHPRRVEFDDEVAIRGPSPNTVRALHATRLAAGKFRPSWIYSPVGQGAPPADFQVFDDSAAPGTIDWETPLTDSVTGLDYVPYRPGRQVFSFTTGAYDDGAAITFGVLARNADSLPQLATAPAPIEELQRVLGVSTS